MTDMPPPAVVVVNDVAGRWHDVPAASVRAELQNLQQLYALLTDEGRATELVALFTSDAVWDGRELDYGMAIGAEKIAPHVVEHFDVDRPMMHLPGPLLLAAISDHEIRGVSWCMATRWVDGQTKPVIFFYYRDVFQRDEAGGWRFSQRVLQSRFR
jgi:SnoaL-like domain